MILNHLSATEPLETGILNDRIFTIGENAWMHINIVLGLYNFGGLMYIVKPIRALLGVNSPRLKTFFSKVKQFIYMSNNYCEKQHFLFIT